VLDELRWYLSRSQAMSATELAYRGYRAARYPVDRLRMRTRRYARPSPQMRAVIAAWRGPEPFYAYELITAALSPAQLVEADAICAGRRPVLGLGWIDLPPDGWHYEPRARGFWPRVPAARVVKAAPAHYDPRLTWELSRGHDWVALARAHAATREPRFIDRLARELLSWRASNPLGIGINWASAMEAAIRIHSLVWCAGLVSGTSVPAPLLAEMIYEHAVIVADHRARFSSANNHAIVELSALVVAALALGGDLARLHAPALAQLCAEVERQVGADGVDAEMATHYHVFVLEALVLVAHLQRAHASPSPPLEVAIRRMVDYLAAIRCDDGSLLQQGDSDDGCILGLWRARHAEQVLAAARVSIAPVVPPARSRLFANAGQVVLRGSRLHVALDAGPFGFGTLAAHAHCDALAIALAVDGRRVLVDRGTYRYNGDAEARHHYRCTAAHNTLQVGTLEQAEAAGPFLWARRPAVTLERCELTRRGDIVVAHHDGFPGWVHRRTLVHHGDLLAILDEAVGTGAPARVTSRYHVAPALAITRADLGVRVEHDHAPLAWLVSSGRHARIVTAEHSDTYASRTEALTLELVDTSERPLLAVIAPADVQRQPAIAALARFAADRGVQLPVGALAVAK